MTGTAVKTNLADQALLDAARAEFERHGLRRTNMDDIAVRAGVSRRTLYRRFPSKDAIFEHLLMLEGTAFLRRLGQIAIGRDPRSAVVECFTLGMQWVREMPLIRGVLETEPEVLVGVDVRSKGLLLVHASELVAISLRASGATMSDDDLGAVSEILLRITGSILMNPEGHLDISDPTAVRRYAERYLARLVW